MTTAVKERPIRFEPSEVRALGDGRKTQKRIACKNQDPGCATWPDNRLRGPVGSKAHEIHGLWTDVEREVWSAMMCPYKVGQQIWVQETWQAYEPQTQRFNGKGVFAGAQMRVFARPPIEGESIIEYRADADRRGDCRTWRASNHLPRWASRYTLEITGVRVERLNAIAETPQGWSDIRAEGVICPAHEFSSGTCLGYCKALTEKFAELWDSIYGKRPGCSWTDSPWCWVILFQLLREPRA